MECVEAKWLRKGEGGLSCGQKIVHFDGLRGKCSERDWDWRARKEVHAEVSGPMIVKSSMMARPRECGCRDVEKSG